MQRKSGSSCWTRYGHRLQACPNNAAMRGARLLDGGSLWMYCPQIGSLLKKRRELEQTTCYANGDTKEQSKDSSTNKQKDFLCLLLIQFYLPADSGAICWTCLNTGLSRCLTLSEQTACNPLNPCLNLPNTAVGLPEYDCKSCFCRSSLIQPLPLCLRVAVPVFGCRGLLARARSACGKCGRWQT